MTSDFFFFCCFLTMIIVPLILTYKANDFRLLFFSILTMIFVPLILTYKGNDFSTELLRRLLYLFNYRSNETKQNG